MVQLNKYETAPNFIQLSQNLTCWFLCFYLFLPVFAWSDHEIVLFWYAEQFYDHIMQKLVKTGKNTEINKQSDVKFCLNPRIYNYNLGDHPRVQTFALLISLNFAKMTICIGNIGFILHQICRMWGIWSTNSSLWCILISIVMRICVGSSPIIKS